MSPATAAALTAAVLLYAAGVPLAIGFLRAVSPLVPRRIALRVALRWPVLGLRAGFEIVTGGEGR